MSESLGVQEARRRLAELLSRADASEQLVINRHGQPLAALVPLDQRPVPQRRRLLGVRGSGRGSWPPALGSSQTTHPARPDSAAATPPSRSPFDPHQLPRGALIGFEAAARLRRPQPFGTQPSGGHLSTGAALELAAAIQAGAAVLVSDDAELLHGRALLPALDLPVVPSSCRPPSRHARTSG